jgi:heptosyltransferase-2
VNAIGKLSWPALARMMRDSVAVIGGDTGLIHLAEALGTPAVVLYGPTVPEMGFGPWRDESQAVGADLWCRPCGKDGRYCYRPVRRYHCLQGLEVAPVADRVRERLAHEP